MSSRSKKDKVAGLGARFAGMTPEQARKAAATKVQALQRGKLSRKASKAEFEKSTKAATTVQAHARGRLARQNRILMTP